MNNKVTIGLISLASLGVGSTAGYLSGKSKGYKQGSKDGATSLAKSILASQKEKAVPMPDKDLSDERIDYLKACAIKYGQLDMQIAAIKPMVESQRAGLISKDLTA